MSGFNIIPLLVILFCEPGSECPAEPVVLPMDSWQTCFQAAGAVRNRAVNARMAGEINWAIAFCAGSEPKA